MLQHIPGTERNTKCYILFQELDTIRNLIILAWISLTNASDTCTDRHQICNYTLTKHSRVNNYSQQLDISNQTWNTA